MEIINYTTWLDPSIPTNYGTKITVLAYRSRWTLQEQCLLDVISIDNPTADLETRLEIAALRQIAANLSAATIVDLSDQRVRDGAAYVLNALHAVSTTIVPNVATRLSEILDTPVTYDELPTYIQASYPF